MAEIEAKILEIGDRPVLMSDNGYRPTPPPPPWADLSLDDFRQVVNDLVRQRGAHWNFLSFFLEEISHTYPDDALALCNQIEALPRGSERMPATRGNILSEVMRKDPDLALSLLKKHLATILSASDRSDVIGRIVPECAQKDPERSFKFFLELPEENRSQVARSIGAGIAGLDSGNRILAAMEETAGEMSDPVAAADLRRAVLSGLGSQINEALGYDKPGSMGADELLQQHRSWLESLDLSPEDCRTLIDGIGSSTQARYRVALADQSNNGILMDYVAVRVGTDGADKIALLMNLWTDGGSSPSNVNLEAPLRWLRETPNSVAKNAAAPAFIDYALKNNLPAEAKAAAMLMPEGFARDRAVQRIEAAEKANP